MLKRTIWTSACIVKPTSSASCSWWWLCYMSERTIWTSACVVKPTSSSSCSWWWLCYMLKRTIRTSACVAKSTYSVSCNWWWLCYMPKRTIWTSACVAKPTSSASCSWRWLCFIVWLYILRTNQLIQCFFLIVVRHVKQTLSWQVLQMNQNVDIFRFFVSVTSWKKYKSFG